VALDRLENVERDFGLSGLFLKACPSCAEDLEALAEDDIDTIFDALEGVATRGA
jgi:hypothetical protein